MLLHLIFILFFLGATPINPNKQERHGNLVINPTFTPYDYTGPNYYTADEVFSWKIIPYSTTLFISTWRELHPSIQDDNNGLGMFFNAERDYYTIVKVNQGGIYSFTARVGSIGNELEPVTLKFMICGNEIQFEVKRVIKVPKVISWTGELQAGNCFIEVMEQKVKHESKLMVFLSNLNLVFKKRGGPTPMPGRDQVINGDFRMPVLKINERTRVFDGMECLGWLASNPSTLIQTHFFNQNFKIGQQGILLSQFIKLTVLKQEIQATNRMQFLLSFDWSETHGAFQAGQAWVSWNGVPLFKFFHKTHRMKIKKYYFQVYGREVLFNTLEFVSKGFTQENCGYIVTNVKLIRYRSQLGHYRHIVNTEQDIEDL